MVLGESHGEQVHLFAGATTPPDLQEPGVNIYTMVGNSSFAVCSIDQNVSVLILKTGHGLGGWDPMELGL